MKQILLICAMVALVGCASSGYELAATRNNEIIALSRAEFQPMPDHTLSFREGGIFSITLDGETRKGTWRDVYGMRYAEYSEKIFPTDASREGGFTLCRVNDFYVFVYATGYFGQMRSAVPYNEYLLLVPKGYTGSGFGKEDRENLESTLEVTLAVRKLLMQKNNGVIKDSAYFDAGRFPYSLHHYDKLTDISPLSKLPHSIINLYLSDHQITDISPLKRLIQLTELTLNDNQLTDVTGLENLTQLKNLTLNDNQLTDVKGLENLTQLTRLTLNDNKLTDVTGLENLTKLEWLLLFNNKLTGVKGLEKLTQLRGLYLNNNKLTDVKGLENLTQLTELYLNNNKLTDVKSLENLTQLTDLRLYDNQLTSVKGLEKLDQLSGLVLRNNKLTDVKGLEKLTQLKSLNLVSNPDLTYAQITELEKALPKCLIYSNPHLTKEESAKAIEATEVALSAFSEKEKVQVAIRWELRKFKGELTKADLEKVRRLDFKGKQLTELPKGLENLTQLTRLSLYVNQLTSVKGLEKLTQLKSLNLTMNQLTDVTGLEKLDQLESLSLRENQLTDVKGLEKLTQLKSLYLDENPDLTKTQIAELQKALPKCKIYSNPHLTKEESAKVIEAAIRGAARKPTGELTKADYEKVTVLGFQVKQLTDLTGLEKLTKLMQLFLYSNQLTDLTGLEKLTKLKKVDLRDNPALTMAQVYKLQKALPSCKIEQNAKLSAEASAKAIEAQIRRYVGKYEGELTKADLEKVTKLYFQYRKLSDLTGLEKLTQLKEVDLRNNPYLTESQFAKLKKALPKCLIIRDYR
jgi:internalin A